MNPEQNDTPTTDTNQSDQNTTPLGQQSVRYVAVDADGKPLPNQPIYFQAPPQEVSSPQGVYMSRPLQPEAPEITPELQRRVDESKKKYPSLNLSGGEYIISAVNRHPIGLLSIWLVVAAAMMVLIGALGAFGVYRHAALSETATNTANLPSPAIILIPIVLLMTLTLLAGYVATIVYRGNKFFLTNESVIQEIQTSLFAKHEQTVSLGNIEDASYTQHGILQMIVGYGSIRLSTEGDETTYRFHYVAKPKNQIALLNNAVEAFKNGRPIEG